MNKSNIMIFILVILVIFGIAGFAIWGEGKKDKTNQEIDNKNSTEEITNEIKDDINEISNQIYNDNISSSIDNKYIGQWYISKTAYENAEKIDKAVEDQENNTITTDQFEEIIRSDINVNVARLEITEITGNTITMMFQLISPIPTSRVSTIEQKVKITNGLGTFSFVDNWETNGKGTITLEDEKIVLKLDTTQTEDRDMVEIEGIYNFTYKK